MKTQILTLALLTAFAGCGGGGSSPNPSNAPVPTSSPSQSPGLGLSWQGAEHSMLGLKAQSLRTLGLVLSEPIAIGTTENYCGPSCSTLGSNGQADATNTATLMIQETNATGTLIPIISSPTVSVTSGVVVIGATTTTSTQTTVPLKATTTPANGTITVVADGLTSNLSIQVLPNLAMEAASISKQYADAVVGYQFDAAGVAIPVTNTATADIYLTVGSPSAVHVPYGFQNLTTSGTGISTVSGQPIGFLSQNTVIPYSQINDLQNTPTTFFVFKTALGKFVYYSLTRSVGQGIAPNFSGAIALYGSFKVF